MKAQMQGSDSLWHLAWTPAEWCEIDLGRLTMLAQLGLLMLFQLVGEALVTSIGIPFPGPLCGMLLLLGYLHARGGPSDDLSSVGAKLVDNLGPVRAGRNRRSRLRRALRDRRPGHIRLPSPVDARRRAHWRRHCRPNKRNPLCGQFRALPPA